MVKITYDTIPLLSRRFFDIRAITEDRKKEIDYSSNVIDTLVCGCCGTPIFTKPRGKLFNIFDRGWNCPDCKAHWNSCDGWYEEDNYLIPYR